MNIFIKFIEQYNIMIQTYKIGSYNSPIKTYGNNIRIEATEYDNIDEHIYEKEEIEKQDSYEYTIETDEGETDSDE